MQSTSVRFVTVVVTALLIAALVYVVRLSLRSNSMVVSLPMATATALPSEPAPLPTPTDESAIDLGAYRTVDSEDFRFRPLEGYTVAATDSSVNMTTGATAGTFGPVFLLRSGAREELVDAEGESLEELFEAYVEYFAEQDNFAAADKRTGVIDGIDGFEVELIGRDESDPFAGRVTMVQLTPDRLFVLVGVAPQPLWDDVVVEQYEAVQAAVRLPEPVVASPTPTRPPATPTPTAIPTSIPLSAPLPTPMPDQVIDPERLSYSNANQTNGAIIHNNTIWTAAEGGIVAWNKENGSFVKFTSLEGLAHNQFDTVVDCPLPGLGIVFGSVQGLQMFDTRNGNWNTLNSQNSAMSFDDVSTVVCDADNEYVIIGYRQHGMDIYDTEANTWTHIDKSSGLENNFVDAIAVLGDREEIWVASGFGITVLTDDESVTYDASGGPLTTNQVNAMRAGPDGTMWIVTPDALFAVRNGRWSEYSTATISDPEFPTGVLVGLDIAADGSIWLASDRAEVCRFDWLLRRCRELYSDEEGMAPGPVTNLSAGEEGYLIYTTEDAGISVYDGEDWRQLALPAEPLAGNSVRSLAQDSEGFIWVVTDGGVSQIHPTEPAVHRTYRPGVDGFPSLDVQTLSPAIDGGMWFGGFGAGSLADGVWTAYNAVDGLAGNVVQVIESDAQNRTWIGTKSGLSIWNGSDFFNLTEENGLPSANISALLPDGERMWIGTDGGGLFRFERSQLRVYNALNASLPSNTINALAMTTDGTLWVGGDRGLARFDGTEAEPVEELSRVEVTAIVVANDETVWIGTAGQGIFVYDGDEWSQLTEKDGLPSLDISALLVDNYGSVWVGGERGGLIRIAAQ